MLAPACMPRVRAALLDVARTLAAIASTTQPQPNPSEQETHP